MVVRRLLCLCAFVSVAVSTAVSNADEAKKKASETVEVKLKDLVLNLPKAWSESDIVSQMRLATYEITPVNGDKEKAELVVSTFGGGVAMNLERWVGQFDGEGREVTIRKGMVGENAYHIANISGTYRKPVGPPVLGKTEAAKGYRMLGVILQVKGKGQYFLKLTGPDATVKAQEDALRASFGGKKDSEEDYEI